MKWKFFSIITALTLALVACNGMNDNNNQDGANDNNVEPTRYNNNTGTGDRLNNDRNPTFERNLERTRNQGRQNNRDNNRDNNDRYDVAEEAAEKITDEIDEIDNAYVLTTENNAYVAATLDTDEDNDRANRNTNENNRNNTNNDQGEELTDEVKSKISDIVTSVDNDIDNVYVSTNPDFFDLTNNYVDDMNDGKPIRGFFDQFGNMIERLFPQNR